MPQGGVQSSPFRIIFVWIKIKHEGPALEEMKLTYSRYDLKFKVPGGTSRGVLHTKETWFLKIEKEGAVGIGEIGLFRGLSYDDRPDFEARLSWLASHIKKGKEWCLERLPDYPSIAFGLEQAFLSLEAETRFELFPSEFTRGSDSIDII